MQEPPAGRCCFCYHTADTEAILGLGELHAAVPRKPGGAPAHYHAPCAAFPIVQDRHQKQKLKSLTHADFHAQVHSWHRYINGWRKRKDNVCAWCNIGGASIKCPRKCAAMWHYPCARMAALDGQAIFQPQELAVFCAEHAPESVPEWAPLERSSNGMWLEGQGGWHSKLQGRAEVTAWLAGSGGHIAAMRRRWAHLKRPEVQQLKHEPPAAAAAPARTGGVQQQHQLAERGGAGSKRADTEEAAASTPRKRRRIVSQGGPTASSRPGRLATAELEASSSGCDDGSSGSGIDSAASDGVPIGQLARMGGKAVQPLQPGSQATQRPPPSRAAPQPAPSPDLRAAAAARSGAVQGGRPASGDLCAFAPAADSTQLEGAPCVPRMSADLGAQPSGRLLGSSDTGTGSATRNKPPTLNPVVKADPLESPTAAASAPPGLPQQTSGTGSLHDAHAGSQRTRPKAVFAAVAVKAAHATMGYVHISADEGDSVCAWANLRQRQAAGQELKVHCEALATAGAGAAESQARQQVAQQRGHVPSHQEVATIHFYASLCVYRIWLRGVLAHSKAEQKLELRSADDGGIVASLTPPPAAAEAGRA